MKSIKLFCYIGIFLAVVTLKPVECYSDGHVSPAQKHQMRLVYLFEANKTEYIFVVGDSGFRSVGALKDFLSRLPPGSELEWSPGCERMGDEPLLSSDQAMKDFKDFCILKNIKFTLVPSG